jgi:hypothetical protein
MVVHLVGLGGSLEGRVAGVVLVLVGCDEAIAGQLCCSRNMCMRSTGVLVPLISSSNLQCSSSYLGLRYRNKDR